MNNKNITTEKELIRGAEMIMSKEIAKFTEFCINITKDKNAKRNNKTPLIRLRSIAYLINSGLLSNGYVEGYEISKILEIDPELQLKFNNEVSKKNKEIENKINNLQKTIDSLDEEKDSDKINSLLLEINKLEIEKRNIKYSVKKNLTSQIRREFSNIERLGYFKTYLCKVEDCSSFPYLSKETYSSYAKRLKQAKKNNSVDPNSITSKVYRFTYLTRDFYNLAQQEGIQLNHIPTDSELSLIDNMGIDFKNRSRVKKSISYNSKITQTLYTTGKIEIDNNDLEKMKNIVEELSSNNIQDLTEKDNIVEENKEDVKDTTIEERKEKELNYNTDEENEMLDLDYILDKLNLYSKDQLIDLLLRKNIIYNDYSWNANYPYKDNPKYEDSINIHFYDDCKSIKDINITEELLYELL